jgi:hypothetical protein
MANTGLKIDPTALVLVAIMPTQRDLEIARVLGWYRVPIRSAPKVVAVDYLAFYQTAAFGSDHRWKIEFLAPVRGHELLTRGELFRDEPDHPRAKEEYYKIQLGGLQPLPAPIHASYWKRFTFLYTTGEMLLHAEELKDLVVRNEERELLWKALRERAEKSELYRSNPPENFEIDAAVLAMLGAFEKISEEAPVEW